MKEKAQNIIFLLTEKLGVPKTVFWGALGAVLITSFAFVKTTYKTNEKFPGQEIKINSLLSKDSAKTIQLLVLDLKLNAVIKNQVDSDMKMEKGFNETKHFLREINRNTK